MQFECYYNYIVSMLLRICQSRRKTFANNLDIFFGEDDNASWSISHSTNVHDASHEKHFDNQQVT